METAQHIDHFSPFSCLQFCVVQIHRDDPIEVVEFLFIQIIFGNTHIGLSDLSLGGILPGGQSHIRLGAVDAGMNNLRSSLTGDGKVKFILHGGKKLFGNFFVRVIIGTALSIDIGDLLIKAPFTGADVPNPFQLFFKIVFPKIVLRIFQPLIIHGKALDDVFFEHLGGPDPEMGRLFGIDSIAYGDDGIEVVVFGLVGFTVGGSMCNICTY